MADRVLQKDTQSKSEIWFGGIFCNYKSHFELYWCEGEDVLDLIKSLIEFVQETKIDDKVYFMFKGNFSGQDYQYYPDDEVLDAAPSKVISEWDDEYSYADVGDCSKEFFDETQPIIEADGSIYSITIDEYNTKTFKTQIEKMLVLHNKRLIDYGPQIWSLFIMSLWMKNNNLSL